MAHPFTRAASPRRPSVTMLCALAGWIASPAAIGAADPLPGTVEFNRDIRPILSDTCFQCHGPDEAKRKADLRLDTEQAVLADLGGYQAIVPGDPAQSELFKRITAESPDERMPPPGLRPDADRAADRTVAPLDRPGGEMGEALVLHPPPAAYSSSLAAFGSGTSRGLGPERD